MAQVASAHGRVRCVLTENEITVHREVRKRIPWHSGCSCSECRGNQRLQVAFLPSHCHHSQACRCCVACGPRTPYIASSVMVLRLTLILIFTMRSYCVYSNGSKKSFEKKKSVSFLSQHSVHFLNAWESQKDGLISQKFTSSYSHGPY